MFAVTNWMSVTIVTVVTVVLCVSEGYILVYVCGKTKICVVESVYPVFLLLPELFSLIYKKLKKKKKKK